MLFFAEFSGEAQRHEEELQAIKECRICWLLGSDHSLGGSGWTAAENPSPTLPLIQLPLQEQDPEFYKFLVEEVTQKSSLRTWVDLIMSCQYWCECGQYQSARTKSCWTLQLMWKEKVRRTVPSPPKDFSSALALSAVSRFSGFSFKVVNRIGWYRVLFGPLLTLL